VGHQGTFADLLRQFRAAANITQEELAERSGLSLPAIAALEQGVRRSPRPSTVDWLAEALKLDALQKNALVAAARGRSTPDSAHSNAPPDGIDAGTLLASMPTSVLPPHAPLPTGSRMPLAPNPLFVGRGNDLLQVAAALRGGDTTVALGEVVASTALGGLGKTQLAVELVHRYGRFFAGVVSPPSRGPQSGATGAHEGRLDSRTHHRHSVRRGDKPMRPGGGFCSACSSRSCTPTTGWSRSTCRDGSTLPRSRR